MSSGPLVEVPTTSCMASATFMLTRAVGLTMSPFTFEEQSFKWPGESWSVEFSMPPFTRREIFADWQSFALKLKGRYGRFLLGDPLGKTPRGVGTGSPVVDGAGSTGNILPVRGFTNLTQGILLKGDYIQLGVGINSRLHVVVEDANTDATGRVNLNIEPAIKISPSDGQAVIIFNARGVFRLASNDMSWSAQPGPVYRINFSAKEAQ